MSRVRRAVKHGLYALGYYRARLRRAGLPGVAVLCFHDVRRDAASSPPFRDLHVTRDTLERVCRVIDACCTAISLETLLQARRGLATLPPRSVLVTFDDGYRGVLDEALPILERYRIPAVVFVCSTPIEQGQEFWFDAVGRRAGERAVLEARRASVDAWRAVVASSESIARPDAAHRPMTIDELRRLAASPLIEIGAHTLLHPTLALASRAEQQREIAGSRDALERMLGTRVRAFAYPYGSPGLDYSADTVGLVRDAGFDLGFSTVEAFASATGNPYEIPRFTMLESTDGAELAHRLAHAWPRTVA